MKKIRILTLISVVFFSYALTTDRHSANINTNDDPYALLDELWQHVYNPGRLVVNKREDMVSGVVYNVPKKEQDGDYHIQIKLDAPYTNHLNSYNNDGQDGCLVIEIICYNSVKQKDAIQPCKSCPKSIIVPKKGDHIKVYGSYITDTEVDHGWNEIHPVSYIEKN